MKLNKTMVTIVVALILAFGLISSLAGCSNPATAEKPTPAIADALEPPTPLVAKEPINNDSDSDGSYPSCTTDDPSTASSSKVTWNGIEFETDDLAAAGVTLPGDGTGRNYPVGRWGYDDYAEAMRLVLASLSQDRCFAVYSTDGEKRIEYSSGLVKFNFQAYDKYSPCTWDAWYWLNRTKLPNLAEMNWEEFVTVLESFETNRLETWCEACDDVFVAFTEDYEHAYMVMDDELYIDGRQVYLPLDDGRFIYRVSQQSVDSLDADALRAAYYSGKWNGELVRCGQHFAEAINGQIFYDEAPTLSWMYVPGEYSKNCVVQDDATGLVVALGADRLTVYNHRGQAIAEKVIDHEIGRLFKGENGSIVAVTDTGAWYVMLTSANAPSTCATVGVADGADALLFRDAAEFVKAPEDLRLVATSDYEEGGCEYAVVEANDSRYLMATIQGNRPGECWDCYPYPEPEIQADPGDCTPAPAPLVNRDDHPYSDPEDEGYSPLHYLTAEDLNSATAIFFDRESEALVLMYEDGHELRFDCPYHWGL